MRIGEIIREERIKLGLTQEELGQQLHVSRQTISSWEIQRTYPDLETIVMISDFFEISLDKLLREDVEMVKTITKEVKSNRRRGKIIVGLVIVVAIMIIASHIMLQDLKSANTTVAPIDNIEASIKLNGDEINSATILEGELQLANQQAFAGINFLFEDETIYIVFYQSPSWRDEKNDFEIKFDNLPENRHFSKVILISPDNQISDLQSVDLSKLPSQKIIYTE